MKNKDLISELSKLDPEAEIDVIHYSKAVATTIEEILWDKTQCRIALLLED